MRFLMPDLKLALALAAWAALQGATASAQVRAVPDGVGSAEPPALLKTSPLLQESIPAAARGALPVFVTGERLVGRPDLETVIEGDAMLRQGDMVIKADRLEYDQSRDLAKARGQVRINRAGNVYEGPLLELKLDAFEGFFNEPRYYFLRNDSHGQADRVDFIDSNRTVIHNATFTTCQRLPGPSWMPDWILRAATLSMDSAEDVGTAQGAVLSFKGVPILPIPSLTFPLSDQRKSGWMPPTMGLDNVNGAELGVPYYWNIAPNRDATFTPTVMSKRGVNLGNQFRYLEADYAGQLRLDLMPADQLRGRNRWGLGFTHQGTLNNRFTGDWTDAGAALNLSLNRVSDDSYWRDFTRSSASLTQRLLSSTAGLSWNNGYFSSSVRTLKWQTLQDVTAPIVPPYDRLPQLATRYARTDLGGFDLAVDADYTRFRSERALTLQPNGQRAYTAVQLSQPWVAPAGFITPRVQLHATQYEFDAPLGNGALAASRVVPTFSLDSGLVFERDASYFGRAFRQTLEPRAFYVNTPYRDQRWLPNYDSGARDFNFATLWTENAFVGNDRISDSNLLTLGLTTRLIDPATGAETARFGVAQRLRFKDQAVSLLGGAPVTDRISDLLLGASVNWDPKWSFDTTVQFNPKTDQSVRATVGARYNPGDFRTVTAAYRYQRDLSEQLDLGWQWPLQDLPGAATLASARSEGDGRWYSVGRLNYSLNERKLVDAILGFEYDAGCWLGRVVLERLQTSTSSATQRIMFQLEFVGFTRLGVSPLKSLKDNIPGYQYLREPGASPSRFSNYD
jgi:LPS-assembly protein